MRLSFLALDSKLHFSLEELLWFGWGVGLACPPPPPPALWISTSLYPPSSLCREVTLDDVMALLVELRDDVRLLLQQDRHPGPRDIRDGGRFEEPPLHRPWEKETPHRHKKHRAWFEDEEDGYEEDGRRPQGRRAWGDRDDDYRRPPRPSRREDREGARGGRRRDAGRHRDAEERWDEEEYQGDRLERDRAPPRGRGYGEAEPPSPPRGGRSQVWCAQGLGPQSRALLGRERGNRGNSRAVTERSQGM